jgi:hypothetical protein
MAALINDEACGKELAIHAKPAPADWPKRRTLICKTRQCQLQSKADDAIGTHTGSPLNAAMFCCTHSGPRGMSRTPKFPVIPAVSRARNPMVPILYEMETTIKSVARLQPLYSGSDIPPASSAPPQIQTFTGNLELLCRVGRSPYVEVQAASTSVQSLKGRY